MDKELMSKNFIKWVEEVEKNKDISLDNLEKEVVDHVESITLMMNVILANVVEDKREQIELALVDFVDIIRQSVLLQFIKHMSKEGDINE